MIDNGSLEERLKRWEPALRPAERRVAEAIRMNAAAVCRMSVQELARAADTSVATVVRFAQRLGFDGVQELKLALAVEEGRGQVGRQEDPGNVAQYEDIRPGMTAADIVAHLTRWACRCVEDTAAVLSPERVDRAADVLANAKKTVFFGAGTSAFVAADAAHKWLRLDRWCQAFSDYQLMLTAAALLGPGDAAVAISYSGRTKETLEAARAAQENGATVIAITQVGDNPLARIADIDLRVTATESGMKRGDIGSRIATAHVIDVLYMALISRTFADTVERLETTHAKVGRRKKEAWADADSDRK